MKRTIPLVLAGLLVASCGGSDASDSTAVGDPPAVSEPTEVVDSAESGDTDPAVTTDAPLDTATSPATDTTDTTGTTDTEAGGIEFDDTALCRSLAQILGASFIPGLIAGFASLDTSDEAAPRREELSQSVAAFELIVYPPAADDVASALAELPAELTAAFDASYGRVLGATPALETAGFSADELTLIATFGQMAIDDVLAGRETDEDSSPLEDPAITTKLQVAVETFLASEGSLLDATDEIGQSGDDLDAYLSDQCPILGNSLENFADVSASGGGSVSVDEDGITVDGES